MSSPSPIATARDTRPRLAAARPDLPGCLASLTQPPPSAPVGAIVDLALLGGRGAGKTQLLYLLLRTLRARAPELQGEEEVQQRALIAAALGGPPPPPTAGPHHAIASLPVASLLAELGPGDRAACYGRTGLGRSLALSALAAAAVVSALGLWRGRVDATAILLGMALVGAGALFGWLGARARWLDLGEIEIALWDPARPAGTGTIRLHAVRPPGEVAQEPGPPPGPADLHPIFAQLVRERRRRGAPWRRHVFAPILIMNPIDLGRDPELGEVGRLRRLLPVFAALGGTRPRAMVAISRWSAVEAVCRPDSDRRALVRLTTSGMGGAGETEVSRETLRRLCLDAEDGRDGDIAVHHLRYDAGWAEIGKAPPTTPTARWAAAEEADEGDPAEDSAPRSSAPADAADASAAIAWSDPMTGLEGEARRAFFRFIASLLQPPAHVEAVAPMPAERLGAGE